MIVPLLSGDLGRARLAGGATAESRRSPSPPPILSTQPSLSSSHGGSVSPKGGRSSISYTAAGFIPLSSPVGHSSSIATPAAPSAVLSDASGFPVTSSVSSAGVAAAAAADGSGTGELNSSSEGSLNAGDSTSPAMGSIVMGNSNVVKRGRQSSIPKSSTSRTGHSRHSSGIGVAIPWSERSHLHRKHHRRRTASDLPPPEPPEPSSVFPDRSDVSAADTATSVSSSSTTTTTKIPLGPYSRVSLDGKSDKHDRIKQVKKKSPSVLPSAMDHIPPAPAATMFGDSSDDDSSTQSSSSSENDEDDDHGELGVFPNPEIVAAAKVVPSPVPIKTSMKRTRIDIHHPSHSGSKSKSSATKGYFEKRPLVRGDDDTKMSDELEKKMKKKRGIPSEPSFGLLSKMHREHLKSASILEVYVYDCCDLSVMSKHHSMKQKRKKKEHLMSESDKYSSSVSSSSSSSTADQSSSEWQMDSKQKSEELERKSQRLKGKNTLVYKMKLNTFHLKVSGVRSVKALIDYVINHDHCKKQRRKIFDLCGVNVSGVIDVQKRPVSTRRGRTAMAARTAALMHSTDVNDYEIRMVDEDELSELSGLVCTSKEWRQKYGHLSSSTAAAATPVITDDDDGPGHRQSADKRELSDEDDEEDDEDEDSEFDFDYPAMESTSDLDLKRWKRLAMVYNGRGEKEKFHAEEASEMRSLQSRVNELDYTEFVVHDLLAPVSVMRTSLSTRASSDSSAMMMKRSTTTTSSSDSTIIHHQKCTLGIGKDRLILMSVLHSLEDDDSTMMMTEECGSSSLTIEEPLVSSSSSLKKSGSLMKKVVSKGRSSKHKSKLISEKTTNANLAPMMIYRFQTSELKSKVTKHSIIEESTLSSKRKKALSSSSSVSSSMTTSMTVKKMRKIDTAIVESKDPGYSRKKALDCWIDASVIERHRDQKRRMLMYERRLSAELQMMKAPKKGGSSLDSCALTELESPSLLTPSLSDPSGGSSEMQRAVRSSSVGLGSSIVRRGSQLISKVLNKTTAPFGVSLSASIDETIAVDGLSQPDRLTSATSTASSLSHSDLNLALAREAKEFLPITIDECKAINISHEDPTVFELVFILINEEYIARSGKEWKKGAGLGGKSGSMTVSSTGDSKPRLDSGGEGRRSLSSTMSNYSSNRSSLSMSATSSKPQSPFGMGSDWSRHRRSLSSDWVFRRLSSGVSESSLIFERMDDMAMSSTAMRPTFRSIQTHGKRGPFLARHRSEEESEGAESSSSSDSNSDDDDDDDDDSMSFMDIGAFKPVSDERLKQMMAERREKEAKSKSAAKLAEIDRMQHSFKMKVAERKRKKHERRMRRMAIVDGMYGTHTVQLKAQSMEECALIVQRVSMLISVEELIVQSTAV